MPRSRHEPPDDPDDWDESDEYDAEHDYDPDDPETYPHGLYTDDGIPTVPCPHCGTEVLEDAERCPRCESYLSKEDAPSRRGGTWLIVMILAVLATIVLVIGK